MPYLFFFKPNSVFSSQEPPGITLCSSGAEDYIRIAWNISVDVITGLHHYSSSVVQAEVTLLKNVIWPPPVSIKPILPQLLPLSLLRLSSSIKLCITMAIRIHLPEYNKSEDVLNLFETPKVPVGCQRAHGKRPPEKLTSRGRR